MIRDVDPHANSEIGTMVHDAWTYWGHSGAPLLRVQDGSLVGLHSSWDHETAMRHGVPLVAIRYFLGQHDELATTLREGDVSDSHWANELEKGLTAQEPSAKQTSSKEVIIISDDI